MNDLSEKQKAIVDAPNESTSVVACAGSGKTRTAVYRLAKIRKDLANLRTHVALLSFSNVAVNTFRKAYSELSISSVQDRRVCIDTFDGFITKNIIKPHSYRTMGCQNTPFLLTGTESFLNNKKYQYWYNSIPNNRIVQPNKLKDLVIDIKNNNFVFGYRYKESVFEINNGKYITDNLGRLGAYTHELGKYWSILTLFDQPDILRVLTKKYSHIIVDEAQDVGVLHECILQIFVEKGVKLTLIGDPNQAIFEFAGADGSFLKEFDDAAENQSHYLTTNYRSLPQILSVANSISGRDDIADRTSSNKLHGAFYVPYDSEKHRIVIDTFVNKIEACGLSLENSAVLYRANSGIDKTKITSKTIGKGHIKLLALATISRDVDLDYNKAFKYFVNCMVGLLKNPPKDFSSTITQQGDNKEAREIRQIFWKFLRSPHEGLPSAKLKARSEWHALVKKRVLALVQLLEDKYGLEKTDNIGNKLTKNELVDSPLAPSLELPLEARHKIRIDTVHQAKGESLDAVLYIAQKNHIEAVLNGVGTELGRIGYVAVTRAKNLFLLGVPKNSLKELAPHLQRIGLKEL